MTKNDIIEEIVAKQIPEKLSSKARSRFRSNSDVQDYIAEMYFLLLDIPAEKLLFLYNEGTLPSYFAKICLNQIYSTNSSFFKKMEYNINKSEIDAGRTIYLEFSSDNKYKNEYDED